MTIDSPQPYVSKTTLLIVSMVSSFMNPLMGSAVNVALPEIARNFNMNAVSMSWVPMAYLLSSAVFLVPFARIADIHGRKKFFLIGNIVFMAATIVCGMSFSGYMLIVGRVFQGIGASMMFSTSMAIVVSAFKPEERGKVIGLNVAAVYLGLSVAPVVGGVLTEFAGWRSLFFINAGASLFIIIAILTKIKAEWIEAAGEPFDWKGTLIYMPSMIALMYGFSKLPDLYAGILTVAGLAGMVLFVLIELKVAFPVFHVKLFVLNKAFAGANIAAFINYAATFAVSFVLSLYLQYVKLLSPREAGIVLIAQPVLMAVVAVLAGRLSDRFNPLLFATTGMAVSAGGLVMLSFLGSDTPISYITASLAVLGFGFGMFSSPNTTIIMSSVDKRHYGLASATVGTMRTTGMMFSMAIASLAVHLFVGKAVINAENIGAFLGSVRLIFIVFSVLCSFGVLVSFFRNK
jgi:MFS family permease